MFTTQFWLFVIGIAQMIGCSWIVNSKNGLTNGKSEADILMSCWLNCWQKKKNLGATSVNAMRMVQEKCILAYRKG